VNDQYLTSFGLQLVQYMDSCTLAYPDSKTNQPVHHECFHGLYQQFHQRLHWQHPCQKHFVPEHHEHHHHSDHLENDGFTSISFQSDRPLSLRKFQYFLDNQLPSNVFRAKGIMWFDESPKRHIFHLSGKRFSIDDSEWKGEKKNQLVLIGQNLDHETLRSQLDKCLTFPVEKRGKGFGNS
jgi:G3E family GTPase